MPAVRPTKTVMARTARPSQSPNGNRRGHGECEFGDDGRQCRRGQRLSERDGHAIDALPPRMSNTGFPPRSATASKPSRRTPSPRRSNSVGAEDALEEVPQRRRHAAPQLQDPGSHQAPPGDPRAGRQGRARQQGRRAHHLSFARRTLLRADAEHGARRRHFAQDHRCRATAAGSRKWRATSKCRTAWD